ncbi:MAG: hypothetical protein EPN79_16125 [Burkholderiaceae bacterium]|nr:MAG: hypothetical protein EPN79_16125 [Burkholderiaceae bacterium]
MDVGEINPIIGLAVAIVVGVIGGQLLYQFIATNVSAYLRHGFAGIALFTACVVSALWLLLITLSQVTLALAPDVAWLGRLVAPVLHGLTDAPWTWVLTCLWTLVAIAYATRSSRKEDA